MEAWVLRAEGDHVNDFTDWAKDKTMQNKVETAFKKSGQPKKWYDTRGDSDSAAITRLEIIIQPLGREAVDDTIKKHDLPKNNAPHTYGSQRQRA